MPLMISRIGHARGRPVFFAAGRWGAITHHSLSVTSVWYRFASRVCCIRVVGVHMGSPGLVSATPLESRRCQPLNLFRNGLLGEWWTSTMLAIMNVNLKYSFGSV